MVRANLRLVRQFCRENMPASLVLWTRVPYPPVPRMEGCARQQQQPQTSGRMVIGRRLQPPLRTWIADEARASELHEFASQSALANTATLCPKDVRASRNFVPDGDARLRAAGCARRLVKPCSSISCQRGATIGLPCGGRGPRISSRENASSSSSLVLPAYVHATRGFYALSKKSA